MSKEAMKQMVKALEDCNRSDMKIVEDAITAGRQAIAEAEKQDLHIGWLVRNLKGDLDLLTDLQIDSSLEKYERLHKLYTHPQQRTWVGLTNEEIATTADYFKDAYGFTQGVLWAEAKLKEKNT